MFEWTEKHHLFGSNWFYGVLTEDIFVLIYCKDRYSYLNEKPKQYYPGIKSKSFFNLLQYRWKVWFTVLFLVFFCHSSFLLELDLEVAEDLLSFTPVHGGRSLLATAGEEPLSRLGGCGAQAQATLNERVRDAPVILIGNLKHRLQIFHGWRLGSATVTWPAAPLSPEGSCLSC